MPNRVIRDWTESETIDKIDVLTERFFTRLIMKVDDYGRYSSNSKLLKSTLFPLKSDIRETDVARWLTECEKYGLVALYNVAGRGYLQINDFRQTLRQKNEKYPPPSDATQMLSGCLADVVLKGKEVETKGSEPHPLQNSNLFRQPTIPSLAQVEERFLMHGGTKEMAQKFFDKHSSVSWFRNGSPITNFANMVPGFITQWNQYSKNDVAVSGQPPKIVLKG